MLVDFHPSLPRVNARAFVECVCYAMQCPCAYYACSHAIGTFLHRSPLTTMIGAYALLAKGKTAMMLVQDPTVAAAAMLQ